MNDCYEITNYDTSELEEAAAKSPALMELADLYGLDPWDIGFHMLQLETKERILSKSEEEEKLTNE